MSSGGVVARILSLQGGFTTGASQLNSGAGSGTPLPGTGPKDQQNAGVASTKAKDTVITQRGGLQGGDVSSETYRRLSPEDRAGLTKGTYVPDQTQTVAQLMDAAYHGSPADIESMQAGLVSAGYLAPNNYLPKVFDDNTAKAYQAALYDAAYSDSTIDELIARRKTALDSLGGPKAGGTKRQPLVVEYTSPEDIQAEADKAAPDLIGHGLSPAQVGDLVNAYHQQEATYQTQRYSESDVNAKGGSVSQPPALTSFLEQELQHRYPVDYQAMQIANAVGVLSKMIGGGTVG